MQTTRRNVLKGAVAGATVAMLPSQAIPGLTDIETSPSSTMGKRLISLVTSLRCIRQETTLVGLCSMERITAIVNMNSKSYVGIGALHLSSGRTGREPWP